MRTETRHSIILVTGSGITALLSVIYSVYAGRRLGPCQYADFTAAVALVTLCYMALGPINGTVAKFTAQYASRREYGRILTLSREITRRIAVYGLIGGAAALILVRPLASLLRFDSLWPLLLAYGMIYLNLLLNVPRGVLRGVQHFGAYNVNTVFEAATRLLVGAVLLAWVCSNAASGLSAYLVGLAVILIVSRFQLQDIWRGHEPQPVDGGAIKRFTVGMFVMMVAAAGFQNIDMLFVKHLFVASKAGHYGAAHTLALSMSVLATPFSIFLLPFLTAMHEQGHPVRKPFVRICSYFLLLSAGALAVFWLWPGEIIHIVYGADFAASAALLFPIAGARMVGLFCYMIALAGASINCFRVLWAYLAGLLVQILAMLVWHESLLMVVSVVLVCQTLTLGPMVALLRHSTRR